LLNLASFLSTRKEGNNTTSINMFKTPQRKNCRNKWLFKGPSDMQVGLRHIVGDDK
jgi:hypothetical protein